MLTITIHSLRRTQQRLERTRLEKAKVKTGKREKAKCQPTKTKKIKKNFKKMGKVSEDDGVTTEASVHLVETTSIFSPEFELDLPFDFSTFNMK